MAESCWAHETLSGVELLIFQPEAKIF